MPHHTCISQCAKTVDISSFKAKTCETTAHLAIDATELKVYDERGWQVKKHGTDGKFRVWRKRPIAVDVHTHEIIPAELSLSTDADADAEVSHNLLKQTQRKIHISGDDAHDTCECHQVIRCKRAFSLIPF